MIIRNIINFAQTIGLSGEDLLLEADCVDRYGEWLHQEFVGYSAGELRRAAASLDN